MSIWAAIAGASNQYLKQDEEERLAKKQEMLFKLQEEKEFAREQRAAERQRDRDMMQAETDSLNRKREDERYAREEERRKREFEAADERARMGLDIQRQGMLGAQEDRRIMREEQKTYREGLAAKAREEGAGKEVMDLYERINKDIKDTEAKNAANLIWGSGLSNEEKRNRLRELLSRASLNTTQIPSQ